MLSGAVATEPKQAAISFGKLECCIAGFTVLACMGRVDEADLTHQYKKHRVAPTI